MGKADDHADSGCRYGELTRLKASDFDEDAQTLTIHQSKSAKTRHVPLTEEGVEFFADAVLGLGRDEPHLQPDHIAQAIRKGLPRFERKKRRAKNCSTVVKIER